VKKRHESIEKTAQTPSFSPLIDIYQRVYSAARKMEEKQAAPQFGGQAAPNTILI